MRELENSAPSSFKMKLNWISGQKRSKLQPGARSAQRSKLKSKISAAGHQVIKNLSELSEFTTMHLDYLRKAEPRTELRAVRALLTTGGIRIRKCHGRFVKVYGPNQKLLEPGMHLVI